MQNPTDQKICSSVNVLMIGRYINIFNLDKDKIKNNKIYAIGGVFENGRDIFRIKTLEQLAFLKSLSKLDQEDECYNPFLILDTYTYSEDSISGSFNINEKEGEIHYYNEVVDKTLDHKLQDLKYRYDIYNKTDNLVRYYLRSTKIEKIENNILTS